MRIGSTVRILTLGLCLHACGHSVRLKPEQARVACPAPCEESPRTVEGLEWDSAQLLDENDALLAERERAELDWKELEAPEVQAVKFQRSTVLRTWVGTLIGLTVGGTAGMVLGATSVDSDDGPGGLIAIGALGAIGGLVGAPLGALVAYESARPPGG